MEIDESAKDYKFYIVFTDDKKNYITAFGFEEQPRIIDYKYVFNEIAEDKTLHEAIKDFENVFDYIRVHTMKTKKFLKYIKKQNEKFEKGK